MATLANLRADVRSRIIEPTAYYFSNDEIDRWINQGYQNFIAETQWAEKIVCKVPVAAQYEYDLPSETIHINQIRWKDQFKIKDRDLEEFRRYMGQANTNTQERPRIYTLWGDRIRLYPIPSTAVATAIDANPGGINSSVTTIPVDSTASFPSTGRLIIENEQILYTGKTSTSFTGCVRGDEYTTAASHADNTAVSFGSIQIYMSYMPPTISASVDSRTGPLFDEALIAYAASIALQKRMMYEEARELKAVYNELVQKAVDIAEKRDADRLWAIKEDDDDWEIIG